MKMVTWAYEILTVRFVRNWVKRRVNEKRMKGRLQELYETKYCVTDKRKSCDLIDITKAEVVWDHFVNRDTKKTEAVEG